MRILICIISLLYFIINPNDIKSANRFTLEKLYLHIDRTYYLAGEKIWFSGYLSPGTQSDTSKLSQFIYVEVLDKVSVITRVKIKGRQGIYAGYLPLPDDLRDGYYILRAYTRQQVQFRPGSEYYTAIRIKANQLTDPKYKVWNETNDSVGYSVHIYPESGSALLGVPNNVGFLIKKDCGMVEAIGDLVDEKDSVICPVKTVFGGMGRFTYIPAKGKRYFLRFFDNYNAIHFELPPAKEYGGIIRVNRANDKLYLNFIYNGNPDIQEHSFIIQWHNSLDKEILKTQTLKGGETKCNDMIVLSADCLQEGINGFRMIDQSGELLCERIYFNLDNKQDDPSIELSVNKTKDTLYNNYELRVQIKDAVNQPIEGYFSISVVRRAFYKYQQQESIGAYMRLASEVSSGINNPNMFFDTHVPVVRRQAMLDLLMLTRDFHRYGTNAEIMDLDIKEYCQTIEGVVKHRNGGVVGNCFVCLFDTDKHTSLISDVGDNGKFIFDDLDFYEGSEFILTANQNNRKKYLRPELIENKTEFILDYWSNILESRKYGLNSIGVEDSIQDSDLFERTGTALQKDTLPSVVITSNNGFIQLDPTKVPLGNTFERSRVKTRIDMQKYGHMNILDYIIANFHGVTKINDTIGGRLVSTKSASLASHGQSVTVKQDPVSVYLDGFKANWSDVSFLNISQIENIVVLPPSEASIYKAPGGVVLIELKKASLYNIRERDYNINVVYPLGYQKYTNFENDSCFVNTVYWNPYVTTKADGSAAIRFTSTIFDEPLYINIQGMSGGKYFNINILQ